jgi:hypothetical protein
MTKGQLRIISLEDIDQMSQLVQSRHIKVISAMTTAKPTLSSKKVTSTAVAPSTVMLHISSEHANLATSRTLS